MEPVVGGDIGEGESGLIGLQGARHGPQHLGHLGPGKVVVREEVAVVPPGEVALGQAEGHRVVVPVVRGDVEGDEHIVVNLQIVGLGAVLAVLGVGAVELNHAQGELLPENGLQAVVQSVVSAGRPVPDRQLTAVDQQLGGEDVGLSHLQGGGRLLGLEPGQRPLGVHHVPDGIKKPASMVTRLSLQSYSPLVSSWKRPSSSLR